MTASDPPLDPMGIPSDQPDNLRKGLRKIWLGFILSLLVHGMIVLWAFGWLSVSPAPAPIEAVAVEVVPAESLDLPPEQAEAEEEAPVEEVPQEEIQEEQPPPEPEAVEPTPEELPPPPEPEVVEPEEVEPVPEAPEAPSDTADAPDIGIAEDTQFSTLTDVVAAAIRPCWTIPPGWEDPKDVSIFVRILLSPDGSLKAPPRVLGYRPGPLGEEAGKNALRAILECSPYALPADRYDEWADMQIYLTP